jgi:hypothetical protein
MTKANIAKSREHRLKKRTRIFCAVAALLATASVFLREPMLRAQAVTYQTHGPIVTPPPEGFLSVGPPDICKIMTSNGDPNAVPPIQPTYSSQSSTLPDGGFLKKNTVLRVNAATTAAITGPVACDQYVLGNYSASYARYLSNLSLIRPDTLEYYNWFAPYQVYSYDSRNFGNFISFAMQTVGNFPFDFRTRAFSTNCNIPTTSDPSRKTVNVTACEPVWRLMGNPVFQPHLPTGPITLYIPPGQLWDILVGPNNNGPAVAATNDLALYGVGVIITPNIQDCGLLGDCVKVSSNDPVSDPGLKDSCARFAETARNFTTGVITGYSDIVLNNLYWPYANADRLQRTMEHELAHGLGLNHNGCVTADSLMSTAFPVGQSVYTACTVLPQGAAKSPTPNDVLPTQSSTYGNKARTVCGF